MKRVKFSTSLPAYLIQWLKQRQKSNGIIIGRQVENALEDYRLRIDPQENP